MKVGIIAFTDKGLLLQDKIVACFTEAEEKFVAFDKSQSSAKQWVNQQFYLCDAIVFIGATGIATRLIAKLIHSKDTDPAIIVLDELGKFVIPLLSGHIGGGNTFALKIAKKIQAVPVITTATDLNNKFAVDVWSTKFDCTIEDIAKIKHISSAVLKDETVGFYSDFAGSGDLPENMQKLDKGDLGICLSLDKNKQPFSITLNVMPKIVTLGVGCRKNTAIEDFEQFVLSVLDEEKLSIKAVRYISSIDLKKEEACIIAFAKKYKIDFITFTNKQLNNVAGDFTASKFVQSITGVDNVCERSAVLQSAGKLILQKTSAKGMTIAIAVPDWQYSF